MLLRGAVRGANVFTGDRLALARQAALSRQKERETMLKEMREAELHPLEKRLLESQIAKNLGTAGGSRTSASGKGGPTATMVSDQIPDLAQEAYGGIEKTWHARALGFIPTPDPEIPWTDIPNAEGKRRVENVDDLATQWHGAGKKAQQQIGLMTGDPNEARQFLYNYYRSMLEAGGDRWQERIMKQFPDQQWSDVESKVFDAFWRGAYGFDAYGSERADPSLPLPLPQNAAAAQVNRSGVPMQTARTERHSEADKALSEGAAPPEESWSDWSARRMASDQSQIRPQPRDRFVTDSRGNRIPVGRGGGGAAPSLRDALFEERDIDPLRPAPRDMIVQEQSGDSDAPLENVLDGGTPPVVTEPPEKLGDQTYITTPSGTPIPVDTPPPRSVRPAPEQGWADRAGGWIEERIEDIAGLLPDGTPRRPMPGSRSHTRITQRPEATPRGRTPRSVPGDSTAPDNGIDWSASPKNPDLPPYIRDQYDRSWLDNDIDPVRPAPRTPAPTTPRTPSESREVDPLRPRPRTVERQPTADTSAGRRRELEPGVTPSEGLSPSARSQLKADLKSREGFRSGQYQDRGQMAIGHGFKVEMLERLGYTEEQVQNMSRAQADRVMDRLIDEVFYPEMKSILPDFDSYSTERQLGLMDMLYNLGLTEFREFDKTLEFIQQGRWHEAADELLDSDAARLLGKRYRSIARRVGGPGYKLPSQRRSSPSLVSGWSDEARM